MLWSPTRGFMCDQDDCRRDQNDRRNDPNDPLGDKNDDRSDPNDRRCDLSDQNEHRYSLTYHRNTTPTQQNRNVKNSQRKSICDKYGMKCERKDTTQQLIAHRSSCDKQRLTTLLVVFILVSLAQPLGKFLANYKKCPQAAFFLFFILSIFPGRMMVPSPKIDKPS